MIPLAERWGIGDDFGVTSKNASEAERSELIEQVAVAPGELGSWLGVTRAKPNSRVRSRSRA
jgi:hypothetical protein